MSREMSPDAGRTTIDFTKDDKDKIFAIKDRFGFRHASEAIRYALEFTQTHDTRRSLAPAGEGTEETTK